MEKKLTLWAARDNYNDGSGEVWLFSDQPYCEKMGGDYVFFADAGCADTIPACFCDAFDSITFDNSPVEVELTIKIKE